MKKSMFIYNLNFLQVAANASPSGTLQIQADEYFELQKLTFASNLNSGGLPVLQTDSTRTIPQCTILITDTGSGAQLMNAAVDVTCLFGNGASPFILPVPRIFKPNSSILVEIKNYSAAQAYDIRLAFIGAKIRQGAA